MFNKVYAYLKNYIKKEWKNLLALLIVFAISIYQFPYYIEATGGILDASKRVEVKDAKKMEGSLHMAYVNEAPATIPLMFISLFNKNWDIIPEEEVVANTETRSEALNRGQLYMKSTLSNATLYAFESANLKTTISNTRVAVLYKDVSSNTNLLIGDIIKSINDNACTNLDEMTVELDKYKANDKIKIGVVDMKGKKQVREATLNKEGKIGIILQTLFDIKTDPSVKFMFTSRESGPSGGLITSLMIYNLITDTDITNGLKIAGTGTIEVDGTVGEIGGIKYKLAGVVKEDVDVFLCPMGDNYDEAMKVKEEFGYDIDIIGVTSFEDALMKLNKMTVKKEA